MSWHWQLHERAEHEAAAGNVWAEKCVELIEEIRELYDHIDELRLELMGPSEYEPELEQPHG